MSAGTLAYCIFGSRRRRAGCKNAEPMAPTYVVIGGIDGLDKFDKLTWKWVVHKLGISMTFFRVFNVDSMV